MTRYQMKIIRNQEKVDEIQNKIKGLWTKKTAIDSIILRHLNITGEYAHKYLMNEGTDCAYLKTLNI